MAVLGGVLVVGWVISTFFFMLEAWGARGMAKSWVFEAWAAMTWCGGPLLVLGVLTSAGVLALRERRRATPGR